MSTRRDLLDLAAHMEFADALVWSTALQSRQARDDERIKGWLHHIHTVQRAFTALWNGGAPAFVDIAAFTSLPALGAWGRGAHQDLLASLSAADDAALARPIVMPWAARFVSSGRPVDPTMAQTVWQLAMHSAHHRGQVNARLRELGAEPPMVDYIAWIWRGQPAPMWPRNVVEYTTPPT